MRIDRQLVVRVESSAAEFAQRQTAALASRSPSIGAAAAALDGGALIAFGPGRYVNRAIGVGFGGTPADEIVAAIDDFYSLRSMAPSLEIGPWADAALLPALSAAGYRLERFRNVYARDLGSVPAEPANEIALVDVLTANDRSSILAGEVPADSDARRFSDEYCDAAAEVEGTMDFVALVDGLPAACGSLNPVDGVGWLGGAATRAEHRGQGLQTSLLKHRLRVARVLGCSIAAATALPDGQSARNLERLGFGLLYTQAVLTKPR